MSSTIAPPPVKVERMELSEPRRTPAAIATMSVEVFIYLQLLDFMTTLVGFELGLSEASPFVRLLMSAGPEVGVLASKGVAILLGGLCIWMGKTQLIRWINYWFAGLVVWNMTLLLIVAKQG